MLESLSNKIVYFNYAFNRPKERITLGSYYHDMGIALKCLVAKFRLHIGLILL